MATSLYWTVTQKYTCPRCSALPTKHCRTPKGRKTNTPHNERVNLATRNDVSAASVPKDYIIEYLLFGMFNLPKGATDTPGFEIPESIEIIGNDGRTHTIKKD
jgi:hypothetical protein